MDIPTTIFPEAKQCDDAAHTISASHILHNMTILSYCGLCNYLLILMAIEQFWKLNVENEELSVLFVLGIEKMVAEDKMLTQIQRSGFWQA